LHWRAAGCIRYALYAAAAVSGSLAAAPARRHIQRDHVVVRIGSRSQWHRGASKKKEKENKHEKKNLAKGEKRPTDFIIIIFFRCPF
jgi:hypothetical protein